MVVIDAGVNRDGRRYPDSIHLEPLGPRRSNAAIEDRRLHSHRFVDKRLDIFDGLQVIVAELAGNGLAKCWADGVPDPVPRCSIADKEIERKSHR